MTSMLLNPYRINFRGPQGPCFLHFWRSKSSSMWCHVNGWAWHQRAIDTVSHLRRHRHQTLKRGIIHSHKRTYWFKQHTKIGSKDDSTGNAQYAGHDTQWQQTYLTRLQMIYCVVSYTDIMKGLFTVKLSYDLRHAHRCAFVSPHKKSTAIPAAIFTKPINAWHNYMLFYYTAFHPNHT